MIHMGAIRSSNGNDHSLIFIVSKNSRSKEKQIMKEKKPKSEIEDESLKPTEEDSMKKVKKKGRASKCSYCSNGFHI